MMLLRALHAELLKIKRTNALRIVAIAPLAVIVLLTFFFSQAPDSTLGRQRENNWLSVARIMLIMWSLLVLPLYVALQTALVAALDHSENQWKVLLARPVKRWMVYVAKLLVVAGFVCISSTILLSGIFACGALLIYMDLDLHFGPVPYLQIIGDAGKIMFLSFLSLTIQHWIAVRFRSFTAAVGAGIIAMLTGYATTILASRNILETTRFYPWTLPMMVMARPPVKLEPLLWFNAVAGFVVVLLGCLSFSRRDVA